MEQTKNEPKNENKAAPGNDKPKNERKPLTEVQRLKRQKMIVLPAMVLAFIGAMWWRHSSVSPTSDRLLTTICIVSATWSASYPRWL